MSYDKEKISEKFQQGKALVNGGRYPEAIKLFSELIEVVEPFIATDKKAKTTWDTSLINRGVSKCQEGYTSGNKPLYEEGLEDFRTTVNTYPEDERDILSAQIHLRNGERMLSDFDKIKRPNFRFWEW